MHHLPAKRSQLMPIYVIVVQSHSDLQLRVFLYIIDMLYLLALNLRDGHLHLPSSMEFSLRCSTS